MSLPVWNPQRNTRSKFKSVDFKTRYKALRNSSAGFIKRQDVRAFINKKYDGRCYLCGGTDNLQIDHIESVYKCAMQEFPISKLNTEDNLALICRRCNSSKLP